MHSQRLRAVERQFSGARSRYLPDYGEPVEQIDGHAPSERTEILLLHTSTVLYLGSASIRFAR